MLIRDCLWLWGQEKNSHSGPHYQIPFGNNIDHVEGAGLLGIPNICRVVMHDTPQPPWDAESERMKDFKQIVWSGIGDGGSKRNDNGGDDVKEVLRQAAKYPNIKGCIMDDFFLADGPRIKNERLEEIRDQLHAANLKLWMVSYDLKWRDFNPTRDFFDVISFWTWSAKDIPQTEEHLNYLRSILRPDQQAVAGCYLHDYGGKRQIPADLMKHQCDTYYKLLKNHTITGVIVCGSPVLGLGFETEKIVIDWINSVADEEI